MRKVGLHNLALILLLPQLPQAALAGEESGAGPWFINVQTGANQGILAAGPGYRSEWGMELSVTWGYSPKLVAGYHDVTQLNTRLNFPIWKNREGADNYEILAGPSLLINASDDTFFKPPRPYPNKYYPPNAWFTSLSLTVRHLGFFLEVSLLDYYMEVLARNPAGSVSLRDVGSLGLGFIYPVDWQPADLLGLWRDEDPTGP